MEHFQTDLWGHASDDIFFRFLTPRSLALDVHNSIVFEKLS